jgi:hypothetical protein
LGLAAFVLAQLKVLPATIGPFRIDLLLMIVLAVAAFGNYLVKK